MTVVWSLVLRARVASLYHLERSSCLLSASETHNLQHHLPSQQQFIREFNFSTPGFKIKIKKDRPLDGVAGKAKELAPLIVIRDLILRYPRRTIPFRIITMKRRELGLRISDAKVEHTMKRFPNAFEFYTHPEDQQPWVRLAPHLKELLKEEKRIYAQQEPIIVEKLKKLLMLSTDHQIPLDKLSAAARFFGFPDDFVVSIIPKYPQHFTIFNPDKSYRALKLVEWDESLAITEFERKEKQIAKEKGLGDIETRGKPLAFKLQYSAGMQIRKKVLQRIDKWQRLPYVCPYQQVSWVDEKSVLAERKMAALLHEILSLTIEKKILIEVIGDFKEEFNLPNKVAKAFNRFPGIFYISVKGDVHTVFLREAYKKRHLLEEHPLISLKWKYYKMMQDGPRLRSLGFKASRPVEKTVGPSSRAVRDSGESSEDEDDTEAVFETDSGDEFQFTDSDEEAESGS